MSSWRTLLLRIGDKCSEYGGNTDFKEHIETCYGILWREIEHSGDDILTFLLQCAEQLPHKIPLYGVLVGLLNLENEEFARKVVDTTQPSLQDALDTGNCNRIRILMRFLTALMCGKVLQPGSIVELFETLLSSAATTVDEDRGNPCWQARADFYITCILSCLPWGGAELVEQVPEEVERIMAGVEAYLSIRKHVYDSGCTVFEIDEESDKGQPEKDSLEDLWDRIQILSNNGWKVDSASLMKQLWRLVSGVESIWTRWIKANYLRRSNIWKIQYGAQSWSFKGLLKVRDSLKPHCAFIIGDGSKINAWYDPWIKGKSISELGGNAGIRDWFLHPGSQLSHLISNREWAIPSASSAAATIIRKEILKLEIGPAPLQDRIIWTRNNSGCITLKSAYSSLLSPAAETDWQKAVWFTHRIPSHSICSWQALRGRMGTLDRISRWKDFSTTCCPLCNSNTETISHIFFTCPYSSWIWQQSLLLLGITRGPLRLDQEGCFFAKLQPLRSLATIFKKLLFNAAIWHIWKERRERQFKGKCSEKEAVFQGLIQTVLLKCETISLLGAESGEDMELLSKVGIERIIIRKPLQDVKWIPPDPGWVKINSDASLSQEGVGLGAVSRNHLGEVDWMLSTKLEDPIEGSILRFELQAALLAVTKSNGSSIWLEMDSKVCVDIINDNCSCPWSEVILKVKIQQALATFSVWMVTHSWREGNKVADYLSKISPLNNTEIDLRSLPFDLLCLVAHDRDGRIYQR